MCDRNENGRRLREREFLELRRGRESRGGKGSLRNGIGTQIGELPLILRVDALSCCRAPSDIAYCFRMRALDQFLGVRARFELSAQSILFLFQNITKSILL